MRLIRGLHNVRSEFTNGCVATIGNYDGMHLGHQQIINHLKRKSKDLNLFSVVVVFEPQPREFFVGDHSLRITSLREKVILFAKNGVDIVLILPFNAHIAAISALDFINEILVNTLKVKHLVVGDDFVFGHRREGSFSLLKKEALGGGFQVTQIPSFKIDGVRVSSSLIRSALLHDNLDLAARFLGRSYRVCGRVVYGEHLGSNIGFPTANIHLKWQELSFIGVYLVKIYNLMAKPLFGLANIGFRPTVLGKNKRFEVYIFDFDANIYGRRIDIEFCKKIRDEQKFSSLKELKLQIKKDLEMAKRFI